MTSFATRAWRSASAIISVPMPDWHDPRVGFAVDWEDRFDAAAPVYMQVSRGGLLLHLTEHHGDCCPGGTVFVRLTGLDAFHAEITAKHYGFMRPGIQPAPWNARVMEVIDPFGNRLRFSECNAEAGLLAGAT